MAAPQTGAGGSPAVQPAPARRTLVVSLYPYIPDPGSAYLAIEDAFEAEHPDVNLVIRQNQNYYDFRPEKGGILFEQADVYEVDSVLLKDFVTTKKVQPLGPSFKGAEASLVPFARTIAMEGGSLVGMPHWLCGNFLIYRAGDPQLAAARTLSEIEQAIKASPSADTWLIADFSGKSTLGEMYLDGAMDRYGSSADALTHVTAPALDGDVLSAMTRAIALVRPGFGRDGDYHDRTGFYGRQFGRGSGRALVGYSESLYYALGEGMAGCRTDEHCLKEKDVQIAEWPLADNGSHPIAWVDMLLLDAKLTGDKRDDAEAFIRFMAEPATYKMLLIPAWGTAPRYLLPAREDLYSDKALTDAATLYPVFRARIDKATPVTAVGLNQRLREIGAQLDAQLPPH